MPTEALRWASADIVRQLEDVSRDFSGWLGRLVSRLSTRLFDPRLSISELAESFGRNETEVGQELRRALGAPPMEVVRRARMEVAARLLRTSDLSAAEIAVAVGFTRADDFSKSFERVYRKSPFAYRVRHQGPPAPKAAEVDLEEIDVAQRVMSGQGTPGEVEAVALRLRSLYPQAVQEVLADARRALGIPDPPAAPAATAAAAVEEAVESWIRGERVAAASLVLGEAARQAVALGAARSFLEQAEAAADAEWVSEGVRAELAHASAGLLWYEEHSAEGVLLQRSAILRYEMSPPLHVRSLVRLAHLELQRGRRSGAIECLVEAARIADLVDDSSLQHAIAYDLGRLYLAAGDKRSAHREIDRIEDRRLGVGTRYTLDLSIYLLARIEAAEGALGSAEEGLRSVHEDFVLTGLPEHAAVVGLDLAAVLLEQGRPHDDVVLLVEEARPTLARYVAHEESRFAGGELAGAVERLSTQPACRLARTRLEAVHAALTELQVRRPTVRLDRQRDDLLVPM